MLWHPASHLLRLGILCASEPHAPTRFPAFLWPWYREALPDKPKPSYSSYNDALKGAWS